MLTGREATEVRRPADEVTLVLDDGREIVGDELLVATGRTPASDALGLETVGLEPGRYVTVDDSMHVLGGWLYAVRRHHRAEPAHPHGQVPGPGGR